MPNREGDKVISSHACKDIPPSFEILGTISLEKKKTVLSKISEKQMNITHEHEIKLASKNDFFSPLQLSLRI